MANIKVLTKLAEARKMFAANPPKKTGHNDEKNYDFFQLEDIVPSKNDIFYSLKLLDLITFDKEKAYLQLTDMESEESITFTSPMPNNLKSIQPNEIQAIGSIETYQRRYLYITALDVIEADPVDTFNKKEKQADNQTQSKVNKPMDKDTKDKNTTKSNSKKEEETVVSVEEDLPMVEVTEADINSLPDPEEIQNPSQQQIDLSDNTAVETKVPAPAPKKETHNDEGESLSDILSFNDKYSPDESVEDLMQKMDKDYILGYKIPIGKYKGQPLSDLSYKLCNWYAENYHGKDNRLIAVATLLSEVKKGA